MQIEVTPAMREAVKRVKEANHRLRNDPTQWAPYILGDLNTELARLAGHVLAAIEEQERKNV